MPKQALVLFSHQPSREGLRKNLGLSAKNSGRFFRLLMTKLARTINESKAETNFDFFIASDGPEPKSSETDSIFNRHSPQLSYHHLQQKGASFDAKFKDVIKSVFDQGYEHVVIMGSDTMDINTSIINDAFQSLAENDMVVGPSTDGGFYLLGLKSYLPQLFDNISWFGSKVRQKIQHNAKSMNLSIHHLAELIDLDSYADLIKWMSTPDVDKNHILILLYLNILSVLLVYTNYKNPFIIKSNKLRIIWQKAPPFLHF